MILIVQLFRDSITSLLPEVFKPSSSHVSYTYCSSIRTHVYTLLSTGTIIHSNTGMCVVCMHLHAQLHMRFNNDRITPQWWTTA